MSSSPIANWDIDNYIARAFSVLPNGSSGMQIYNIDRAKFSGMEMSARYENNGFTAELGANYYFGIDYCQNETGCEGKSIYGDFATNFIPPKYSASLTLSQKLMDDALTVGGRISYIGPRAIEHGQVTAQGLSQFITKVEWEPYWLVDLYADYKINDKWSAGLRIENVFDQYYVDPLGLVQQPGPGRTVYASLTGSFGGSQTIPQRRNGSSNAATAYDWSGVYAGVHAGLISASLTGATTDMDGTASHVSMSESADHVMAGFHYGLQFGYNHQFSNRLVLGIEADWSRTSINGTQDAFATEGDMAGTGALQAKTHYEIDWMSSVRGRIGYAVNDRLLAYGTGGVAFLRQNQTRDQYRADMGSANYPYGQKTGIFSVERQSGPRTGFTVGGGVEYALSDRWSVKGDYTYSRFGKKDWKFEDARAGIGREYRSQGNTIIGSSNVVNGRNASNSLDLHAIKIGLNYRF